ncbi:MAG: hypothetical protein JOZ15_13025 [Acidobacteria bacterium]|nr:hypothetical protein [Acidobacteriota bacterium]
MGIELRTWLLSVAALAVAGAATGAAAAPAALVASPASPATSPSPLASAPGIAAAIPSVALPSSVISPASLRTQAPPPPAPPAPSPAPPQVPESGDMPDMPGMGAHATHEMQGARDMEGMPDASGMHATHGMHAMTALLGPYPMTRESSGTSWQPESAPHEALFTRRGAWLLMLHGQVFAVYDDQESKRGGSKWFSENHLLGMATRELGPGRLGLRAMVSAEPWSIGRGGYPLLMQTGETADGRTELVDRQHPHDLFDELAATYSLRLGRESSLFVYLGLPGEPALGPPTYVHRFSAIDNPETPLSHHWLDSTHISYGVTTLGWTLNGLKLEGSAFRGREPDQHRADIESPSLDSFAFRVSYQPDPSLSVQGSFGHLKSPEQLAPNVDVSRSTVSVMYNVPLSEGGNLQSTLAWGRNQRRPGRTTNAYLFEGTAAFLARHTVYYRMEELENDELAADVMGLPAVKELTLHDERGGQPVAVVTKLAGGYVYDFLVGEAYRTGAGFDLSVAHVPVRLEPSYGADWVPGWMLFLRFRLGGSGM